MLMISAAGVRIKKTASDYFGLFKGGSPGYTATLVSR